MEIVLIKWFDDVYLTSQSTSVSISHLGHFLTDDVGCRANKFYKEWLNNPEVIEGGGNYSTLIKHGNKVKIYFEYDHFEHGEAAMSLEITIDQLNYILDRWQEACEKKPNKIIITRDDRGKITVDFED